MLQSITSGLLIEDAGRSRRSLQIDWTSQMAGYWQSRFDPLEDLLKRMEQ
jgi:hypothetical protein